MIIFFPFLLVLLSQDVDSLITQGSENKFAQAAREFVEKPFQYDMSMGYYTLTYKDGSNTGKFVYPNGDLDPSIGVCTDLIVRVFRKSGYDLQKLVYEDAAKNMSAYPYANWGMTKPNANIDHRRVPMLNAFFRRFAKSLTTEITPDKLDHWQAGDIVIWDLTGKGKLDHIGIVSDKRLKKSNRPLVIDNFPDPGYVFEGDRLEEWTIRAHYRFPR